MPPTKTHIAILSEKPSGIALLVSQLEKSGFEVTCPASVDKLSRSTTKDGADVVLLDLEGKAPLEAIKKIKGKRAAGGLLPVIVVYDKSSSGLSAQALEKGADASLRKPLDVENAVSLIKAMLRTKKILDETLKKHERLRNMHRALTEKFSKIEEDLNLARRLQRGLLPSSFPDIPGVRFSCRHFSSTKMTGDFYDVFRLDEKHVGFYVADAVGHGVAASLLTVFIKKGIKTKEISGKLYWIIPPEKVLQNLNQDLIAEQLSGSPFITMCYCIYNHETGLLNFASAGHPSPVLFRDGQVRPLENTEGALLGVFDNRYTSERLRLKPKDRILLFTDGVDYTKDREGNAGALAFFNILEKVKFESIENCLEEITRYLIPSDKEGELEDDISLFGLEIL